MQLHQQNEVAETPKRSPMKSLALLEIAFFSSTFIGVVCWDMIFFQTCHFAYPYRQGFAIFSALQWIAITLGMVAIFVAWIGIVTGLTVMTLGIPFSSLLGGILLKRKLLDKYQGITALFAINVWSLILLSLCLIYLS